MHRGRPAAPETILPANEIVPLGQMVATIGDVTHSELVREVSSDPTDPYPAIRFLARNGLLVNWALFLRGIIYLFIYLFIFLFIYKLLSSWI